MSGFLGKTETVSNVTPGTGQAHDILLAALTGSGRGVGGQLFPGTMVDNKSIQPYLDLFTQQNTRNLAQAKESAGNLTGSGLGNIIGARAGEANVEQGAFLANLFEARRREDANRFLQAYLGALGSPAGGTQTYYTPGFVAYLGQGATALAGGGAFNNLFGGGKKGG